MHKTSAERGNSRSSRVGTVRLVIAVAVALALLHTTGSTGFGGYLHRGQTRPDLQTNFAGSSLATQSLLRPSAYTSEKPEVQANAMPEEVLDLSSFLTAAAAAAPVKLEPMDFAMQFLIALIPAIVVEFFVLEPVQNLLASLGLRPKKEDRDYVAGSDETIKVQRAFDFQAWEEQRKNPDRYWSILVSTMLTRLQGPLFFLNLVAASVLFYSRYLVPDGYPVVALPTLPFTLCSFALGLLVTFRVNTSNNRYVTARNKWGSILNISRDLSQQACLWAVRKEDGIDYARWVPAFSLALMCHLRDPRSHDLEAELRAAAGPEESANGDAPVRAMTTGLGVTDEQRLLMEHNITRLVDDLGACENIFATPIPLGYTKHLTRFLFLWLLLLPLALENQLGYGVVFVQQLLAFGLLGVEDIGIQIEEPFAVLPLKRITTKIALEAQIVRKNASELDVSEYNEALQAATPPLAQVPAAPESKPIAPATPAVQPAPVMPAAAAACHVRHFLRGVEKLQLQGGAELQSRREQL
eukprot:CAMPEP_0115565146 /NCGR_PEP_ID=MMETSP0271-20121206/102918_1 /TAXON_ID=71861 /ORGANISM="Scrippsiella trochoidea, Strain CCMP3099" /LENGTH=524 /DNA_ID=CAMNT_0002999413 /DNA_START=24 /DNA_END=1596 /DNA_ORIENTATION=-